MKFNTGDMVKVRDIEPLKWCGKYYFTEQMSEKKDDLFIVESVNDTQDGYILKSDSDKYTWTDEMLEEPTEEEILKFITGKAIHCETEEKADLLLKFLNKFSIRWRNGQSLLHCNEWGEYKENTCYLLKGDLNELSFDRLSYYKSVGEDILELSLSFAKQELNKEDIKKRKIQELLGKKVAIHCNKEEKAVMLLGTLDQLNCEWRNGDSVSCNRTYYSNYGKETCYDVSNPCAMEYGTIKAYEKEKLEIISFDNVDLEIELYSEKLDRFNGHEWIKYYENPKGVPHIKFAEGCHYQGVEGLQKFEENVLEKYGDNKDGKVYKQYMLIADSLRLNLDLPCRTVGNVIKITSFKGLFKDEPIQEFIKNADTEDYYTPKNFMWLYRAAQCSNDKFMYLNGRGDDRYYDLVTVEYLGENIAIPVPILADILKCSNQNIYDSFDVHEDRDEVNFI